MLKAKSTSSSNNNSANIGFEAKLWPAADKLRSNTDAAEYKHVVLGLIFLKYISDRLDKATPNSFGERRWELMKYGSQMPADLVN